MFLKSYSANEIWLHKQKRKKKGKDEEKIERRNNRIHVILTPAMCSNMPPEWFVVPVFNSPGRLAFLFKREGCHLPLYWVSTLPPFCVPVISLLTQKHKQLFVNAVCEHRPFIHCSHNTPWWWLYADLVTVSLLFESSTYTQHPSFYIFNSRGSQHLQNE